MMTRTSSFGRGVGVVSSARVSLNRKAAQLRGFYRRAGVACGHESDTREFIRIRAVGDGGHTLAVPFITPPLHHSITSMTHRRTGKIARLSHEDREEVCRRLRDNRPAREIIAWAATRGVVLRAWNVSRWALEREKYRDACQAARAELAPRPDFNRPLTEEERLAIIDKVDEIMGLKNVRKVST
jgi:hypothetical protein